MTEPAAVESLDISTGPAYADECCAAAAPRSVVRDAGWHRAAGQARLLAWISLIWMGAEGAIGLWQGFTVGSIALIGWVLGSTVEASERDRRVAVHRSARGVRDGRTSRPAGRRGQLLAAGTIYRDRVTA